MVDTGFLKNKFMEQELNIIKINMAELQKDITFIKESLVKNDDQHKEIIGKIDSFIQNSHDRFADKKDHIESLKKIDEIIETLDSKYVSVDAFSPIRKLAYGLTGAILLAVVGAILALILNH